MRNIFFPHYLSSEPTDIQQDFYDQLKLTIKHNFINFQRDFYKKNKRKKTIIMSLPFKCI